MQIVKREKYTEKFNKSKIVKAIQNAFADINKVDNGASESIADLLTSSLVEGNTYHIEDIQDLIEGLLMDTGHRDVAKAYILYRQKRTEKREKGWQLNDLQQAIWDKKYNYNNETFDQWLTRVSGNNPKIKKLIRDKKFIFAGRILAHRGIDKNVTYSNCYVMKRPEDNIENIYQTASDLARTYSYGGGCGVDISNLRPAGATVNNSAKTTSGAVSFMSLYDLTTGLIGQNGRRGALMISIADSHPDLPEFLNIKTKDGSITKANISVRISDAFMTAVKNDEQWTMRFKVETSGEIITRQLRARELYRTLCINNWDWAEPGALYWDRIEQWHLMSEHPDHEFHGVNPCAEEPLMAGGSCLLGSINLSEFVKFPFTNKAKFDFAKYRDAVRTAVVGLNEVLDEGLKKHPLQIQRDNAELWRQIGLGPMGIADMLIKLGIRYGSAEALKLSEELGHIMINEAVYSSCMLAKKYGTFANYSYEALEKSEFYQQNVTEEIKALVKLYGLRNSQLLTIAPTGSISTMWGISGGIEPIFAISFSRKTESLYDKDVFFEVFTDIVREVMTRNGITLKEDLPNYIVTSHDLDYKDRIKMQSVWQKHIDASISSTVNLHQDTLVEQVEDLYYMAWEYKLKGITVYRDNCKRGGILTVDTPKDSTSNNAYATDDKYKACPDCGEPVKLITNGCAICQNCGGSPCN